MKYNQDEIRKRISDKTFEEMSLKIDDLAAIGRVLSIQDEAYDEQFEGVFKSLKQQREINAEILSTLKELRSDISELKSKVSGLEGKIEELTKTINTTRDNVSHLENKVDCLDRDVQKLKKMNSFVAIALRIAIGVGIALALGFLLF